jgi:hypothetical protein
VPTKNTWLCRWFKPISETFDVSNRAEGFAFFFPNPEAARVL